MSTPVGSITGRVVGAAGAPVANATVAIAAGTQPYRDVAAVTSADGSFRFGGIRPGTYRVEARVGSAMHGAEVTVDGSGNGAVEIRVA